jgi:uncharacterized protein YoxC
MPDSVESRLLRLERETAMLSQRVEDINTQVTQMPSLVREVVTLTGSMNQLQGHVQSVAEDVHGVQQLIDDRERRASEERRSVRVALIGLSGTIIAAMIAAIVTLIAAGAL